MCDGLPLAVWCVLFLCPVMGMVDGVGETGWGEGVGGDVRIELELH